MERLRIKIEGHNRLFDRALIQDVQDIFSDVQKNKDRAIIKATADFDNLEISEICLSEEYADRCVAGLTPESRSAIDMAIETIGQGNRAVRRGQPRIL
jgi:histidinol dehydrogenase